MLNSPALSPRLTERRAQELIHEFLLRYFQGPAVATITAGSPTIISTIEPHALKDDQTIHLANVENSVPNINGARVVTVIDDTTFAINIDTTATGTFTKAAFTLPRISNLGDSTFPYADLFYNQANIPAPANNPQIHVHFTDFRPVETWFASGNLSDWTNKIPIASGVDVGITTEGNVEESVHGRLARSIPGTDYRIRYEVDGAHEEVLNGSWQETRFIAGATAIRWFRTNDYNEQAKVAGVWTAVRTISPGNPTWDGSKKLVAAPAMITFYIRVANAGSDANAGMFLCRAVSDNLKEIFQGEERSDLAAKGMRGIRVMSGPTIIPTNGWQQQRLVVACTFRYFLPRQF